MLATSLPYIVQHGRANATVDKYRSGWLGWVQWSITKSEMETRPAHPFFISLYLNHLFFLKRNKGCINTAFYGIRWAHHVAGLESPTDNLLVKLTLEGCLRLCEGEKLRKDAMPVEALRDLVDTFPRKDYCLIDQRFLVVCLTGFAGFFRIQELLGIQLKHISVIPDHLQVFLPHSKVDQHRDGETVFIAKTGTKYCPVTHIQDFLEKADHDIKRGGNAFLILRLHKTKKEHVASKAKRISYSRMNEIFHENMNTSTNGGADYGLHSLRAGGASAAAQHGVSARLISKQGRWSSESARNGYIQDNTNTRLSLSLSLGL